MGTRDDHELLTRLEAVIEAGERWEEAALDQLNPGRRQALPFHHQSHHRRTGIV
jgi:hypothetical protein